MYPLHKPEPSESLEQFATNMANQMLSKFNQEGCIAILEVVRKTILEKWQIEITTKKEEIGKLEQLIKKI